MYWYKVIYCDYTINSKLIGRLGSSWGEPMEISGKEDPA